MKYLSELNTPNEIMGICYKKKEENISGNILILDNIQDPGNLGTIIRSSLAFNVDTIVTSLDTVDLYNPKVLRSTQGMIFHLNIVNMDLTEAITKLKKEEYPIYGTKVEYGSDVSPLPKKDRRKYALVMGNEGNGISSEVSALCDKFLYIDMNDKVESLNVAVATSILLYELNKNVD